MEMDTLLSLGQVHGRRLRAAVFDDVLQRLLRHAEQTERCVGGDTGASGRERYRRRPRRACLGTGAVGRGQARVRAESKVGGSPKQTGWSRRRLVRVRSLLVNVTRRGLHDAR